MDDARRRRLMVLPLVLLLGSLSAAACSSSGASAAGASATIPAVPASPTGALPASVPATSAVAPATHNAPYAGTIHAKDRQGYTFDVSFDLSVLGPVTRSVVAEPPGKYAALVPISGTFQVRSTTTDRDTPSEQLSIGIDAFYPAGSAACIGAPDWRGETSSYSLTSPSGTFCDRNLAVSSFLVPALSPGAASAQQALSPFGQGNNSVDRSGYPQDVAIYRDIDAAAFASMAAALPNPAIYSATIGYMGEILTADINPLLCSAVEPPHNEAEFDASKPSMAC